MDASTTRIIDRFDKFAEVMSLSDARVTKECNLAIGTLGKSRKPGKDLSKRTTATLLAHYPQLSREWLINGLGAMLLQKPENIDYPSYPIVDTTRAECGPGTGLAEALSLENLPMISVPGIPRDTNFFLIATGFSMINRERPELSIPPGALVGVAKPNTGVFMRWGEVYAVATADGLIIKRLLQDDDPQYVICVSYNSGEFPPFRLPKSEIYDVARVTCVVPVYIR